MAAQRAVAHLVGTNHRVTLHTRHHVDGLLREPDFALIAYLNQFWYLLEEDDEPAYQAFLEPCEQVRDTVAGASVLPGWLAERARDLDAAYPSARPT